MNCTRLALPTLFVFAGCSTNVDGPVGPPEVFENASALVHEREIRASIDGVTTEITIPVMKKRGAVLEGELSLRLIDVSDAKEAELATAKLEFAQKTDSETHRIRLAGLPANITRPNTAPLVLVWSIDTDDGELRGKRSLYAALGTLEVHVRGATDVPAGGTTRLRVITRDPETSAAKPSAEVLAQLVIEDQPPETLGQGLTNERGELELELSLPTGVTEGDVRIEVRHEGSLAWTNTRLRLVREEKLALSFDKTIYKPGQTLHLRTLALTTADKRPVANTAVRFEAKDGKGNKVFRRSTETDNYGIASMDVPTDTEVNEGEWTFTVETAGARTEEKVPVVRYTLPKLRVAVKADQSFAKPGETLTGHIEARYLFGLPVAGAQVAITAKLSSGEIAGSTTGQTTTEGVLAYQLPIAEVSGPKIEDASERLFIEATVTDTAEQREVGGTTLVLTKDAIVIKAIAEAGVLVPGVENTIFILVSDPLGQPLVADLSIDGAGPLANLSTDADGLARIRFTAPETDTALSVTAVDGAGRSRTRAIELSVDANRLLVRSDKSVYRAGEVAHLQVHSKLDTGRVFLDVFRGGVSVKTIPLELEGGVAEAEFAIESEQGGVLLFDAFQLAESGRALLGHRKSLVIADDRLSIVMQPDRETYGPGENANITVQVTDGAGNPKVAALGLFAVDEAVFALGGEPRDDLYLAFALDPRVLDPNTSALGRSAAALFSPQADAAKEKLAELMLAGAATNSFVGLDYNSVREEMPLVRDALSDKVERDTMRLMRRVISLVDDGDVTRMNAPAIVRAMAERSVDAFGQYYRAELSAPNRGMELTMISAGADERFETGDDVAHRIAYEFIFWADEDSIDADGTWAENQGPGRGGPEAFGAFDDAQGNAPPAAEPAPNAKSGEEGGGAAKVRTDFRETIFSQPKLVTDSSGRANIQFPLAHSITTWRLTAQASTQDGFLGSQRLGFRTFQRFFVDLTMPSNLTRGDEVEVPAVVYNYLAEPQNVTVTLESAPWMSILSSASQSVSLEPSEVRSVRFRIRAEQAGDHALTLRGSAGAITDALVRVASVTPNGTREDLSFSDELGELTSNVHTITVPADAVEGGTKVTLSLTPGFAAQAVQGMEAMVKEPSGCFEQTTSTAWPNTLVVTYMEATGQMTPEMRETMVAVVTRGYQRLLTFESPTGGFNWWGDNDPGNRILSAIMLWHLDDLESIIEIDPAVRERTMRWLLEQQEADGRWPSGDALHSGNEVLGTSDVRTTAFIAWALAHTGLAAPAVERAATWIEQHPPAADDLYAHALAMNALAMTRPNGAETSRLLARLDAMKLADTEGRVKWPTEAPSWTGAGGDAAAIETTGLVAYGLIQARAHPENAAGAMRFLVSNKDSVGSWYNTQATMNALRALLAAASPQGSDANGLFEIEINGQAIDSIAVTPETGDLLRKFDLTPYMGAGQSSVEVRLNGTGKLTYQLSRVAYRPNEAPAADAQLSLQVEWPNTSLSVGQTVQANVVATYQGVGTRDQVMVRVGRAPGFAPMTEDLEAIVASGRAARYEMDDRFVTFYLMGLESGVPRSLATRFVPTLVAAAEAPASEMYVYYEPTIRTEVAPVAFTVDP